jgi:hypothetical protein
VQRLDDGRRERRVAMGTVAGLEFSRVHDTFRGWYANHCSHCRMRVYVMVAARVAKAKARHGGFGG